METTYIYESPDKGNTIYRRAVGSFERELIQKDGILFEIDPATKIKLEGLMEKYIKDTEDRNRD